MNDVFIKAEQPVNILSISDLHLGYLDNTVETVAKPGTDLILINGGICKDVKRGLLYAEQQALANPNIPCIFNLGFIEYTYNGSPSAIESTVHVRLDISKKSPDNLRWAKLHMVDVGAERILAITGWPNLTQDEFEKSFFAKNLYDGETSLQIGDKIVSTRFPALLTFDKYQAMLTAEHIAIENAKKNGVTLIVAASDTPVPFERVVRPTSGVNYVTI